MGNKCCSKRQEPDAACPGSKKTDFTGMSQSKYINGSIDSRYTQDPSHGIIKSGVDFIRPRQPTRK